MTCRGGNCKLSNISKSSVLAECSAVDPGVGYCGRGTTGSEIVELERSKFMPENCMKSSDSIGMVSKPCARAGDADT